MRVIQITRNAALKKDEQENFWLTIQAAHRKASFNLTAAMANKVTHEPDEGFQSMLEAFMDEQHRPIINSPN